MEVPGVHKRTRVSYEQREKMLEYMMGHSDLAKNRMTGPVGARRKAKQLIELGNLLNNCPTGATKSPDKWMKCWQDWRSDVKAKSARIRRAREETGGTGLSPLTPLEESLMAFIGHEAPESFVAVDPLEISGDCGPDASIIMPIKKTSQEFFNLKVFPYYEIRFELIFGVPDIQPEKKEIFVGDSDMDTSPKQLKKKPKKKERLEECLEAQTAALEKISTSIEKMSMSMTNVAMAITNLAITISNMAASNHKLS